MNVALFVPLGLLLPLVVRVESVLRAVASGLLVSLSIDTVQFINDLTVSPGRIADVDDLIGNTVGTMLGYAAYSLLVMIPAMAQLSARSMDTDDLRRDANRASAMNPTGEPLLLLLAEGSVT